MNHKNYDIIINKTTLPVTIKYHQSRDLFHYQSTHSSVSPAEYHLDNNKIYVLNDNTDVLNTDISNTDISELSIGQIIYNDFDTGNYRTFELSVIYQHVQCRGRADDINSYYLTNQGYIGTTIIDDENRQFILFAKQFKPLLYPIFVVCCHEQSYCLKDFIDIYPFLIKHIKND
ncbi:MAG TPA: hypothetical protein VLG50_06515 [Candidatus Saccharimonadales bacterium]|nr:hypothetical protein [Candidatus Saccharimonadales bacterium]